MPQGLRRLNLRTQRSSASRTYSQYSTSRSVPIGKRCLPLPMQKLQSRASSYSVFSTSTLSRGIFWIGVLPVFPTTASGGGPCSSGQAGDYRPIYSGSTNFRLLGQLRPSSRGTPHDLG